MQLFDQSQAISTTGRLFRRALALAALVGLASCGGGGGSSGSSKTSSSSTSTSSTSSSTSSSTGFASLPAASTLAGQCAVPRSGTDPYTGTAYTDSQGSLLTEQNWLAAWTYNLYLWYGEVPYPSPANYSSALSYFAALKTPNLSASGAAKDKFHFSYNTTKWEALASSGVQAGYGVTLSVLSATPPRSVVVAYTEPNSPATQLSPVLARGASILYVDGVDVVNNATQAGVDVINAGAFPSAAGESHTFVVRDLGASTTRSFTLTSANVTSAPVQNVGTLAGGAVGYMLFNDHLATAELALINAVTQLKSAGVSDLVLDVRYNGGGYLTIASELAYMIAGPTQTSGKTFELLTFNDKHPTTDPVTGETLSPIGFQSTAVGFSATSGTVLPHLDLSRVFVLTGPDTCSASESIINSLRGVGVNVIQIGSTTCGKPYGFYPQDNCGTTYFSIQFKGVNAAGFGDYSDGFTPANSSVASAWTAKAVVPGCAVADDFSHALGNASEARVAAALQYRSTGICPTASSLQSGAQLKQLSVSDGQVYKTPFLSNRILVR